MSDWTRDRIVSDPRFAKATPEQQARLIARATDAPPGMKEALLGTAKSAVSEALMRPGSNMRDLATNPITQAKALPSLAGTAAAITGVPMGATIGTVGGRQISNRALKAYGREDLVPSTASQIGEGALSVAGDLTAIPAITKRIYGPMVGAAEKASGIANVEKEAPPGSARTAVKLVQMIKKKISDGTLSQEMARAFKPAVKTIFDKGWLRGTEYLPDAVEVNQGIQSILNQDPIRAEAAQSLARSQVVPHAIKNVYKAIPRSVKYGIGVGTGAAGAGGLAYALGKKLFGDSGGR